VKTHIQTAAAVALVTNDRANAQVGEALANLVEASSWQADVTRVIFSAGDDPRLAVGGEPHSLRLIELGILKPLCSGKAIRFPNPPCGIVSWLGKRRSYESRPTSGRPSMVSVRTCDPSLRASAAGIASSKKNQAWAPRPERDRSTAAGRFRRRHAWRKAAASWRQSALSKSTARKKHVSSYSSG
jgi:hypothetical protein